MVRFQPSLNPKRTQWGRRHRYIKPQAIPTTTPIMSTIKSFMSALRLKLGWMSSIIPPKALAPTNTGSNPKRPVLARGKESAAKAMRCTTFSLPSGACGGVSKGQSIATVMVRVTIRVIGMSRYLRITQSYWSQKLNATTAYKKEGLLENGKCWFIRGFGFR